MTSVYPNFTQAARQNQAYVNNYGRQKSVTDPVWVGSEGDRAALQRTTYPSPSAKAYFNSPLYNQQLRNFVTTGLQGRGKSIRDRTSMTGKSDYSTYGKKEKTYELVSMDTQSGLDNMDMLIGVGILGAAVAFILFTR